MRGLMTNVLSFLVSLLGLQFSHFDFSRFAGASGESFQQLQVW